MNKIKRNDRVIVITEKTRERRVQYRLLGDGRAYVWSKHDKASHQGQPANESTWRNYRKRSSIQFQIFLYTTRPRIKPIRLI